MNILIILLNSLKIKTRLSPENYLTKIPKQFEIKLTY